MDLIRTVSLTPTRVMRPGTSCSTLLAKNQLGELVVIKCWKKKSQASAAEMERLRDELRILRENQTCIQLVSCCQAFQTNTHVCCLLNYHPGITLTEFVNLYKDGDSVGKNVVATILLQLSFALDHLHSRRIVHRDVSSKHVLITSRGRVKLSGFSQAVPLDSPRLLEKAGDEQYMAPEAFKPEQGTIGPAADFWALGVVTFFVIHGFHPYSPRTDLALFELELKNIPYSGKLPRDVKEVLEKILQIDASVRIKSSTELQQFAWLQDWVGLLCYEEELGFELREEVEGWPENHDIFGSAECDVSVEYEALSAEIPVVNLNLASTTPSSRIEREVGFDFDVIDHHTRHHHHHIPTKDETPSALPTAAPVSSYQFETVETFETKQPQPESDESKGSGIEKLENLLKKSRGPKIADKIFTRYHNEKYSVVGKLAEGVSADHYLLLYVGKKEKDNVSFVMKLYGSEYDKSAAQREYEVLHVVCDVATAVQVKTAYAFSSCIGIITHHVSGGISLEALFGDFSSIIQSKVTEQADAGLELAQQSFSCVENIWRKVVFQLFMFLLAMQQRGVKHGDLTLKQIIVDPISKQIQVCGFSKAVLRGKNTPCAEDQQDVMKLIIQLMGFGHLLEHQVLAVPLVFSQDLAELITLLNKGEPLAENFIKEHAYFAELGDISITRSVTRSIVGGTKPKPKPVDLIESKPHHD